MDDSKLILENQICFPIYSASRLITKVYKPFLDELGLTYTQYLVLIVLWETDEISVNTISEKLMLNSNTLSPLLQRMEKMELLKRTRSNKDERNVIVELTEKGKQLKAEARSIPEKLLEILLNENINLTDVMKIKNVINEWIEILSERTRNTDVIQSGDWYK